MNSEPACKSFARNILTEFMRCFLEIWSRESSPPVISLTQYCCCHWTICQCTTCSCIFIKIKSKSLNFFMWPRLLTDSPGQRWAPAPEDLPSSSSWRSGPRRVGGCRASPPPSSLPPPPQTHPGSALLWTAQTHGETEVSPWWKATHLSEHR